MFLTPFVGNKMISHYRKNYDLLLMVLNWVSLTIAAVFALTIIAHAKPTPNNELVLKAIHNKYTALGNWRANFSQIEESVGLGTSTYSEGYFVFKAPNKFIYSIVQPVPSDFISDGKQVWYIRFPEGRKKPAYVRHFQSLQSIELHRYLFLLRGLGNNAETKKDFDVKAMLQGQDPVLEIRPKKSSELSFIGLRFANNSNPPKEAVLEDSLGNKTIIKIQSTSAKQNLADTLFAPSFHKDSKIEKL